MSKSTDPISLYECLRWVSQVTNTHITLQEVKQFVADNQPICTTLALHKIATLFHYTQKSHIPFHIITAAHAQTPALFSEEGFYRFLVNGASFADIHTLYLNDPAAFHALNQDTILELLPKAPLQTLYDAYTSQPAPLWKQFTAIIGLSDSLPSVFDAMNEPAAHALLEAGAPFHALCDLYSHSDPQQWEDILHDPAIKTLLRYKVPFADIMTLRHTEPALFTAITTNAGTRDSFENGEDFQTICNIYRLATTLQTDYANILQARPLFIAAQHQWRQRIAGDKVHSYCEKIFTDLLNNPAQSALFLRAALFDPQHIMTEDEPAVPISAGMIYDTITKECTATGQQLKGRFSIHFKHQWAHFTQRYETAIDHGGVEERFTENERGELTPLLRTLNTAFSGVIDAGFASNAFSDSPALHQQHPHHARYTENVDILERISQRRAASSDDQGNRFLDQMEKRIRAQQEQLHARHR